MSHKIKTSSCQILVPLVVGTKVLSFSCRNSRQILGGRLAAWHKSQVLLPSSGAGADCRLWRRQWPTSATSAASSRCCRLVYCFLFYFICSILYFTPIQSEVSSTMAINLHQRLIPQLGSWSHNRLTNKPNKYRNFKCSQHFTVELL